MRMAQNLILIPVLVQVLLTFAVLLVMGAARYRSAREARKSAQDYALATNADWSEHAQQCANCFRNQFELPVLFYAVCLFALVTRNVDAWLLAGASLFALSRIAHAVVHMSSNVVSIRASAYLIGAALLLGLWLMLTWRVAAAGW